MKAYLCLITWPDGTEGLLFPRPGNVPIADSFEKGEQDFIKARQDLIDYARTRSTHKQAESIYGTTIRLVEFERKTVLMECTI